MARLHSTLCATRQRLENLPNDRSLRLRLRELSQQNVGKLLPLLRPVNVSSQHSAGSSSESIADYLPCPPTRQSADKMGVRLPFVQPVKRLARVCLAKSHSQWSRKARFSSWAGESLRGRVPFVEHLGQSGWVVDSFAYLIGVTSLF